MIAVGSLFEDSEDKAYVLRAASTLTNDVSRTSDDDGFSQTVQAKAGLRMKSEVTLKPRVSLAPYRTFPELKQPLSDFIFRAKCIGEGIPALMLVQADGGRWKLDAIKAIQEALQTFDLGVPIIA